MSFEEGRDEFIKKELKKKRVDELAGVTFLLVGPAIAMKYPEVTFVIMLIALGVIFHMVRLSTQLYREKEKSIAFTYSCLCLPAILLNFYLGLIMILAGYAKFLRTYRTQVELPKKFMEAQNDPRYFGIILSMVTCIAILLIYSIKVLPPALERIS